MIHLNKSYYVLYEDRFFRVSKFNNPDTNVYTVKYYEENKKVAKEFMNRLKDTLRKLK